MRDTMGEDEYVQMVIRDVNGAATEEESASLVATAESASEWRDALSRLHSEGQSKLTKMRAEQSAHLAACLASGPSGRAAHAAFKKEADYRRARISDHLGRISERLREAKQHVHALTFPQHSAQEQEMRRQRKEELHQYLCRIEEKLDRLLATLEDA